MQYYPARRRDGNEAERSRPGIEIRSAAPSESEAIASVLYQSFAEFRTFYTDEAFRATTLSSDGIRLRMDEGPVWIALHAGAIFGTVSAVPRGAALYVCGKAVLPSARGKGTGRLLLGHVEAFARAERYQSLILSTTPS